MKVIVEEYVATAEPVSSKAVVERYDLPISSATVRNDMAELETAGYIRAPHTSAGRVPTEKGYSHYIAKFAHGDASPASSQKLRQAVEESSDPEGTIRALARELVALTGDMAIAAFGPDRSFFTGMGSLMNKPDFQNLEVMREMSAMLDRFDEVVQGVLEYLDQETVGTGPGASPRVMLGATNPFGKETAAVVIKCRLGNGRIGLLGLIGPMRMDYPKNLGLMEEVVEILDNK